MKKILLFLLAILCLVCCSKQESESDRYYVKYYSYAPQTDNVTVETESGTQTFARKGAFEETFGPVSKGFNCKITTTTATSYRDEITQKIYVAKNSEQFLLKSEKHNETTVSSFTSEYTIDF